MNRHDAGYQAGQGDALALRLENPRRFRSVAARKGYCDGYESRRRVRVDTLDLSHSTCVDEARFRVGATTMISSGEHPAPLSNFNAALVNRGSRWFVTVTDSFYAQYRPYIRSWVRQFWNRLHSNYRGLLLNLMCTRLGGKRLHTRGFLNDYLMDNGSPLAGYATRAWSWHKRWPLFPETLPFPADAGSVVPAVYDGAIHWFTSRWAPACDPWHRACPESCTQLSSATPATVCCSSCYRMRPLPTC